jgi:AcrR family transcriptional regulator
MPTKPPPTPRQREILDHAVTLLREQGLPGLTMRRLAERIGFSEAALYRHFANKGALLAAIMDRLAEERLLTPVRRIAQDEERSAGERLRAVLEHQLTTLAELEGVPILFLAEALAAGDEELLARGRRVFGEMTEVFESLIRRLPARDGSPPPQALAFALFGLAAATALRFRLAADPSEHPDPAALVELAHFITRRLTGSGEEKP